MLTLRDGRLIVRPNRGGHGGTMARTSLGNTLRQMAAEHRAADALGMTAEAVHRLGPERVGAELSRRQLLGGAAAVAGAATLAQIPFAGGARAAGAPRIAVVGAGIS